MPKHWQEISDTGDVVKNDQTVTLRVYHAKKKVHGKMTSQCPGGCGKYLSDEERDDHRCPGPPRPQPQPKKRKKHKASQKAPRKAWKAWARALRHAASS